MLHQCSLGSLSTIKYLNTPNACAYMVGSTLAVTYTIVPSMQNMQHSAAKHSGLQHGQSLTADIKWKFKAVEYCIGLVVANRPMHNGSKQAP